MKSKGHDPTPLMSIVSRLDADGSGDVEFEEWCEKRISFTLFHTTKGSVYQDRLGTNKGKHLEKEMIRFLTGSICGLASTASAPSRCVKENGGLLIAFPFLCGFIFLFVWKRFKPKRF
eukprot:COSAG06_NODE_1151_length_10496_cov_14.282004_13_plen_118_part_00